MEFIRRDSSAMGSVASFEAREEIPREVCNIVFQHLHKDLRLKLNFHSIYPVLNAHHLLSQSVDQSHLTSPYTTPEKQVDMVFTWLRKYRHADYLTPFVDCLLESSREAGEAHEELARSFKSQCSKEMLKWRLGNRSSSCDFDKTERDGINTEKQPLLNSGTSHGRQLHFCWRHKKLIGGILMAITILSIACITCSVIFTDVLPNKKGTALGDHMLVYNDATVPIEINTILVRTLTLTFLDKTCSNLVNWISEYDPEMAFIPGASCSSLNTTIVTYTNKNDPAFWYALPGSQINITISPDKVLPGPSNTIHVWIINLQFLDDPRFCLGKKEPCHNPYRCEEFRDICFVVNSSSKEILFTIKKAGYYRHTYSYANDTMEYWQQSEITWTYLYYIYDVQAINEIYRGLKWHNLEQTSNSISLGVANAFEFPKQSCALLQLHDLSHKFLRSCVQINASFRWDIIFLIFVAYITCISAIVCAGVSWCIFLKLKVENKRTVCCFH